MSITSLGNALSGLKTAQAGLAVTGQNISNSSTTGYSRQQSIQIDSSYVNIGVSNIGSYKNQLGLGAGVAAIRQLRNKFYDATYRDENSESNFFARKYTTGEEINNIIGELQSQYKAQDAINGIWTSIQEAIKDPSAIETRSIFIQNSLTFLNKMQDINKNLNNYQMNLNEQVKNEVNKINNIVSQIADLNMKIENAESAGNRANDERDARNNLLDELSGFLDVEIKEIPIPGSSASRMDILVGGKELLVSNQQSKIGFKYSSPNYPFIEPVFTNSSGILPASADAPKVFENLATEDLGPSSSGTKGSLKSLLISRGNVTGNYTMLDPANNNTHEVNNFLIPKIQAKMDKLVNHVVKLLNENIKEQDLHGNPGVPIFIRKNSNDANGLFDANGNYLNPEVATDYSSLFTLENIELNPALLGNDGYNKLGFSKTGQQNDTTVLEQLSKAWKEETASLEGNSIDIYYKQMIVGFGIEIQDAKQKFSTKIGTTQLAQHKRLSISAVSLDEELSNMMKYQHAYNSAAKAINVIDSMLDKVINGTGRVGA